MQSALDTDNERGARARWEKALDSFREQAGEVNRRITAWNLKIPSAAFQRQRIEIEREVSQVERHGEAADETN
jgi:hypothetical protein